MCGIVALYSTEAGGVDRTVVSAMRDTMVHRGPDDADLYVDDHVGLGHRRLSILDLTEAGRQPMVDASGQVWVCYNGEIYNFPELRRDLEGRGYVFRTRCDTEVILALYNLDGEEGLALRLNGIFAFALWDAGRRRLVLVRDRVGIKPLYLWRGPGLVAAASEIKALLAHPRLQAAVREEAIPEYLAFRQVSGFRTLFRDVEQVAPGEMVVIQDGEVHRRTYWSLPRCGTAESRAAAPASVEEAKERLDGLLRDATHLQMLSDVPLGTYNSGGVDSSLVTSYVAEKAGDHLETFCIGLEDPRYDERSYARLVQEQFNTAHHELVVDETDYADHLPRLLWHHDEPLTHPNTLPIYLLSHLAKQEVTVVLTGEGCDEFFGGYPRYRLGEALDKLGVVGRAAGGVLARMLPIDSAGKLGKVLRALRSGPEAAIVQTSRYVSDGHLQALLTLDRGLVDRWRTPPEILQGDIVSSMLEFDQRNYLLPILHRLDKASMAFSLEARVPFLDHRILEFAATVPSAFKLRQGENKHVVKQLAAERLPHDVVYRKKSGLAMPLADWFRDPDTMGRYLDMLDEPRSRQRSYLDGKVLSRVVREHRRSQANHAELLWGLLNLELWQRVLVEGDREAPSRPEIVLR